MKVRQGITLEVFGQDGISVAPVRPEDRQGWKQKLSGLLGDFGVEWDWGTVAGYLARVRAAQPAQDVAYLAPHGALRQYVMGGEDRRAAASELTAMQALLHAGAVRGRLRHVHRPHLPALLLRGHGGAGRAGPGAGRGGPPAGRAHAQRERRDRRGRGRDAHRGRASRAAPSTSRTSSWPAATTGRKVQELVESLELARLQGLRITADQYPYAAGSTMLGAILPPWAHDGGTEATLARLARSGGARSACATRWRTRGRPSGTTSGSGAAPKGS